MAEIVLDRFVTEIGFKSNTRALDKVEGRVDRLKGRLQGLSNIALGVGAALTAGFTQVFGQVVNFDKAVNNLKGAVRGLADNEFDDLIAKAKELGSTTEHTASEVVQAMAEMGRGGLSFEEILEALPTILDTTTASSGKNLIQIAAEFVGNLQAGEIAADRFGNALAVAASSGNTTIDELNREIGAILGIAKNSTVSVEELLSVATQLRTTTVKSVSEAVTSIKTIYSQLSNLNPGQVDIIESLGLDPKNIERLSREGRVLDIFSMFKTRGLQRHDFEQLFGVEHGLAASGLADQVTEIRGIMTKMTTLPDELSRQAEAQREGLPGAIANVKSAIEGVMLSLDGFRETAITILNKITEALRAFVGLPEPIRNTASALLALGPAIIGFGVAMKGIAWLLPSTKGFNKFLNIFKRFGKMGKVGLVISGLAGSVVALGVAFAALNFDKFSKGFSDAFSSDSFKGPDDGLRGSQSKFFQMFDKLGDSFNKLGSSITEMFNSLGIDGESLAEILGKFLGNTLEGTLTLINFIIDDVTLTINAITSMIEQIKTGIQYAKELLGIVNEHSSIQEDQSVFGEFDNTGAQDTPQNLITPTNNTPPITAKESVFGMMDTPINAQSLMNPPTPATPLLQPGQIINNNSERSVNVEQNITVNVNGAGMNSKDIARNVSKEVAKTNYNFAYDYADEALF